MRNFHFAGRSTVHAQNAMVATSHPDSALVAINVMRAGGTATDAAVAACALLGVIEPQSTGLGGDCFALIQPKGTTTPSSAWIKFHMPLRGAAPIRHHASHCAR
jgi:gamma-glutamyltranspeptidase/glutathione hydrolase